MKGATDWAGVRSEPFFLDAPGGRLCAVHHQPRDSAQVWGQVLFIPPFNEEMNRCRSMVTLQVKALAEKGLASLVLDPHGTGDSEGDYVDARWKTWLAGIRAAIDWLDTQPGGITAIVGVRLGAILAAQAHAELKRAEIAIVFWQPVLDGKVHLTQFFRIRIAAQLDRPDLPKETTGSMRQQLAAGQTLEVAGYEIHADLANAIDSARLANFMPPKTTRVLWLEHASPGRLELSIPGQSAVLDWERAGIEIESAAFSGPAFWQVHERVIAPTVIDLTSAWLGGLAAER